LIIKVVLDTNILVSALWTPAGNASFIISLVLTDRIIPCIDHYIMNEYLSVLSRPKLSFPQDQTEELLTEIRDRGIFVTVPRSTDKMPDEMDRKFYDVAKFCKAFLVTGNLKHFPKDKMIMNPAKFIDMFMQKNKSP